MNYCPWTRSQNKQRPLAIVVCSTKNFYLFLLWLLLFCNGCSNKPDSFSSESINRHFIWIEAENSEIPEVFRVIDDPRASGGKAIQSLYDGRGPMHGGTMSLFTSEVEGEYVSWWRVNFFGFCANTFFASVNPGKFYGIQGSDIYNQWTWVRGPTFHIIKGKNSLQITNRERFAEMDRILLTNDPYYIPEGLGEDHYTVCDFNYGLPLEVIPKQNGWKIERDVMLRRAAGNFIEKLRLNYREMFKKKAIDYGSYLSYAVQEYALTNATKDDAPLMISMPDSAKLLRLRMRVDKGSITLRLGTSGKSLIVVRDLEGAGRSGK